jgi:hypothetical protein
VQNVAITRKGKGPPIPCRLFFILARKAPIAVIFRRGPSGWVQLINWNTSSDEFVPGQWFHGRIYERRCDLSPNGSLLIYFCNKINARTLKDQEYTKAWTAISHPPYLTALALWPKRDCWHGGGLFQDEHTVWLNHKPAVAKPHPKHMPKKLKVISNPSAHGEDDPIFSMRLERDGWKLIQEWKVENRGYPKMFATIQPEIREKSLHGQPWALRLIRSISALDYKEEFAVVEKAGNWAVPLEGAAWADWDRHGRLALARDGRIFVLNISPGGSLKETQLLDLNPSKPAPTETPYWAKQW